MSTAPPLPSVTEVLQLPATLDGEVQPSFIDVNGHMNVRHYLDLGAHGVESLISGIGVDDDYRNDRRMGLFAAEHHLRYVSELPEASRVSVHPRVLARSARTVHVMSFLLDRTRQRLSYTLEVVVVHVDMKSRRPTPLPADIAGRLDGLIAASTALAWPAPVCGAMGVRASSAQS